MSAYYNEFDKNAAAWLRELIKKGHIADGIVDERSIEDVAPNDIKNFTQCHFFAGIGVWSAALRGVGWVDFPLVDGAPARVVRLRGYGNAIVKPVAEGFIESVMSFMDQ